MCKYTNPTTNMLHYKSNILQLGRSSDNHILCNTHECRFYIFTRDSPLITRSVYFIVHTYKSIGARFKGHSVNTTVRSKSIACHCSCHHSFLCSTLVSIYTIPSISKCPCGCCFYFGRLLCCITFYTYFSKEITHRYNLFPTCF